MAKLTTIFSLEEFKCKDETSQKLGNKPFYTILKNLLSKMKSIKTDINEMK